MAASGPEKSTGKSPERDPEMDDLLLRLLSVGSGKKLDERTAPEQSRVVLAKLKEDQGAMVARENYDRSQAETSSQNVQEIRKQKPESIIASSDRDGFRKIWRREAFYKKNTVDASEVLVLADKGRFDPETKQWFDELRDLIKAFAEMNSDVEFSKNYKKSFKTLIGKYGEEKVYGSKGLFQFLNTYHRARNLCPKLAEVTKADFNFANFSLKQIKLVVGNGSGREGGRKDRYAIASWKKKPDVSAEPATADRAPKPEVPGKPAMPSGPAKPAEPPESAPPEPVPAVPAPKPDPAPSEPPKPSGPQNPAKPDTPKPTEKTEMLELGTDEFYAKYDIKSDRKAEFKDYVKTIDDILKSESGKFFDQLTDSDFWAKLPPVDPERTGRISELFDSPNGKILKLFNRFEAFNRNFEAFLSDAENSDAMRYQYAYLHAGWLLGNYNAISNNISDASYNYGLILEYCGILLDVPEYKDSAKKQLVEAAKFVLKRNSSLVDEDARRTLAQKYHLRLEDYPVEN